MCSFLAISATVGGRSWVRWSCGLTQHCCSQLHSYVPGVTTEMVLDSHIFMLPVSNDLGDHRLLHMAQRSCMSELISHVEFSGQRAMLMCLHSFQTEAWSWSIRMSTGRANVIVCICWSALLVALQTEEVSTGAVMLGSCLEDSPSKCDVLTMLLPSASPFSKEEKSVYEVLYNI